MEMKQTAAWEGAVGCRIPHNSDIRMAGKASSHEGDISRLGPSCAYRCFPEDDTYAVVSRDMVSINQ
jgi:hypothetical protein